MLSSRRFYVGLNNDRSRWRNQKNGLPQGSELFSILFNIYTNDQPLHDGTRNFVYADDLCVTAQYPSFTEVEHTIEEALYELTPCTKRIQPARGWCATVPQSGGGTVGGNTVQIVSTYPASPEARPPSFLGKPAVRPRSMAGGSPTPCGRH